MVFHRGLNALEYRAYFEAQEGRCAICRGEPAEKPWGRLQVDHCHESGDVRGLLCGRCNRGLGNFSDDPAVIQAALVYLAKHHPQVDISNPHPITQRTECPKGHAYTEANTGYDRAGWRYCKQCRNDYSRRYYESKIGRKPGPSPAAQNAEKTHCPNGHPYDAENTRFEKRGGRVGRKCKVCESERKRAAYAKKRVEGPGRGSFMRDKTHCPRGHEYNDENTYQRPNGSRVCKVCRREKWHENQRKE